MADERHDHDKGLELDLPTILSRRQLLVLGGAGLGAGLLVMAGCGSSSSAGSTPTTVAAAGSSPTSTAASTSSGVAAITDSTTCTQLPEETAGPYPGDGSNGPDVLGQSGVVRSDITASFAGLSGTATGVPLSVRLKVLDVAKGCTAMPGAAVYLWHADAAGRYSLYSKGVTDQNYLRGVQAADADGWVTFTTIVPGCYDGRWPHIHFEVYETLTDASKVANKIATSQIALPQDMCEAVYADTAGYPSSATNLKRVSLSTDNVFRDGWATQLPTVSGDVSSGFVAQMNAGV
jgi:protocatechuate 3,4-dioxygenase beta subunit